MSLVLSSLQIVRLRGAEVPIVVVGNKSDLEARRVVSRATTQARVELDWNHGYMETCALKPDSVLGLFKKVLHQGQVGNTLRLTNLIPTRVGIQLSPKTSILPCSVLSNFIMYSSDILLKGKLKSTVQFPFFSEMHYNEIILFLLVVSTCFLDISSNTGVYKHWLALFPLTHYNGLIRTDKIMRQSSQGQVAVTGRTLLRQRR